MKVFITGGNGFIGQHTIDLLINRNHELTVLLRKPTDTLLLKNHNVKTIIGDILEKETLIQGMKNCDYVIHLAGRYTFWEADKRIYSKINIKGTQNVMECVIECGIKKIIHISTAGIFGVPENIPFNEESTPGPVRFSEYFKTKYEGDKIAWNLFDRSGLPLVVIYPVCVVGEGDTKASGRYIKDFINKKLPAEVFKNHIFTFVYVKDVAQAIVNALEKEDNIGEKYLVGNYKYKWGEINRMISEISGVPLPKFSLSETVTMLNAYLLTGLANIIKKPPLWGMAVDQMQVMKAGFNVDGSKVQRELGIEYTPIRSALQKAIYSLKN
jgi:dihydroflavonol-4-reductase